MNLLRRLLGRRGGVAESESGSNEIPHEVQAVIAGASVSDRSTADQLRLVLVTHGYGAFVYERDSAREWLKTTFSLSDAQTARALHMLASHVAAYQQMASMAHARTEGRSGSSWRDWRRLEI